MSFQVSCPSCDSRMKLKDQLYEERVRGRVAQIRCTRCKEPFDVDGRHEPADKKLPSWRPGTSAGKASNDAHNAAAPSASTAPAPKPSSSPAAAKRPVARPVVVESLAPSAEAVSAVPHVDVVSAVMSEPPLAPSRPAPRTPSAHDIKSLFSIDEARTAPGIGPNPESLLPKPSPSLSAPAISEVPAPKVESVPVKAEPALAKADSVPVKAVTRSQPVFAKSRAPILSKPPPAKTESTPLAAKKETAAPAKSGSRVAPPKPASAAPLQARKSQPSLSVAPAVLPLPDALKTENSPHTLRSNGERPSLLAARPPKPVRGPRAQTLWPPPSPASEALPRPPAVGVTAPVPLAPVATKTISSVATAQPEALPPPVVPEAPKAPLVPVVAKEEPAPQTSDDSAKVAADSAQPVTVENGATPKHASQSSSPAPFRPRKLLAPGLGALVLGCAGLLLAHPQDDAHPGLERGAVTSVRRATGSVVLALEERERADRARAQETATVAAALESPSRNRHKRSARERRRERKAALRQLSQSIPKPKSHARAARPKTSPTNPSQPAFAGAFNIARASQAVSSAAARARFCGGRTAVHQRATVTMTFEPSGKVRVLRIGAPLTRSVVGACVAGVMRATRVPAFKGNDVTVVRSVAFNYQTQK